MAHAPIALNAAPMKFEMAEIGNLLLYNQNLDGENPPAAWVCFRQRISGADAVLFVTPEYGRSVPGALTNALDVPSGPVVKNAWDGKPGAGIGVSPRGARGIRRESPLAPVSRNLGRSDDAEAGSTYRRSSPSL
jgi:chromate reductase, NAD(P)H dehydrogenase (quinone)